MSHKSKDQSELSENEINEAFFGSDEPSQEVTPQKKKKVKDDLKDTIIPKVLPSKTKVVKKIDRPKPKSRKQKLEESRKRSKSRRMAHPTKLAEARADYEKSDKVGRPVYWTPERLNRLKIEEKRQAEINRTAKLYGPIDARYASNEPLTAHERRQVAKLAVRRQEEIHEQVVNDRDKLRDLDKVVLHTNRRRICKCIYSFTCFSNDKVMTACKKCSAERIFDLHEWHMYIKHHKHEL